ncbi:hypothetical protein AAE02nite_48490 [Adhaeribacter aerolatus]|uniref:Uncharacterized protein n=1 Tax=Adhaeribacter aerolatus TaxID=670289 RepID=A0A512B5D1_9BACT|nr:hypothetical protein [Adhaeribacter aerolatus]GEO07185.1 hypothetical protein AAE02nite_48490 [Adhaeribacter aerolatus]
MAIIISVICAAFLGYLYGHYIRPKQVLRNALKDVKQRCIAVLEEGNKGVYRTIVTDNNQSSELIVEVKELAVTKTRQVKVQYLDAFYKNPEFRTRKGEALLKEVQGLLGDYLPGDEIEWYDNTQRHDNIKKYLNDLNITHYTLL